MRRNRLPIPAYLGEKLGESDTFQDSFLISTFEKEFDAMSSFNGVKNMPPGETLT